MTTGGSRGSDNSGAATPACCTDGRPRDKCDRHFKPYHWPCRPHPERPQATDHVFTTGRAFHSIHAYYHWTCIPHLALLPRLPLGNPLPRTALAARALSVAATGRRPWGRVGSRSPPRSPSPSVRVRLRGWGTRRLACCCPSAAAVGASWARALGPRSGGHRDRWAGVAMRFWGAPGPSASPACWHWDRAGPPGGASLRLTPAARPDWRLRW